MLLVISGPSCVGKSFCVEYLANRYQFGVLTGYTARPSRPSESEGIHYHFRSEQELRALSANFGQGYWGQPLGQYWYGYSSHLDELPSNPGNWIIHASADIALRVKRKHPATTLVFLDFENDQTFRSRLELRYGGKKAELVAREKHARGERQQKKKFDHIILSDNPEVLADRLATLAFSLASQTPLSSGSGPLSDADILASLGSPHGIEVASPNGAEAVKGQIRGWSLDLTLSPKFYRVTRRRFVSRVFDLADSDEKDLAARFRETYATDRGIVLKPKEFILASTNEKLTLPRNLVGLLSGRSSYSRLGVSVELSQILLQPGHDDTIPLQIVNHLPYPIVIYSGTAVAQVVFFRTVSDVRQPYNTQVQAKYLGKLADLRSRFYEDKIYKQIRSSRPKTTQVNWDHVLNVLLFLLIWALAGSWLLSKYATREYSNAARAVEIIVFLLTTLVGIVRGYRLLWPRGD
jgi:dCTP deaminase